MIIYGRNLIVKINGTPVGAAKACEIVVQSDEIETSSATQGKHRTFIPGRIDWTAQCSHFVTAVEENVELVGQVVTLTFGTRNDNDQVSGSAIVKSWKANGAVGNLSTGDITFRGTGPLS